MYEPDFDDYWESTDLVIVGECEGCEQRKLVVFTTNPYDEEINDDHTLGWICAECHYESSQDI